MAGPNAALGLRQSRESAGPAICVPIIAWSVVRVTPALRRHLACQGCVQAHPRRLFSNLSRNPASSTEQSRPLSLLPLASASSKRLVAQQRRTTLISALLRLANASLGLRLRYPHSGFPGGLGVVGCWLPDDQRIRPLVRDNLRSIFNPKIGMRRIELSRRGDIGGIVIGIDIDKNAGRDCAGRYGQ